MPIIGAPPVLKGSLFYSVKDYGAKGDGTTDDTAAIAAAMDAADAAGTSLHFPRGNYICGAISKTYAPRITGSSATITATGTGYSSLWTFSGVESGSNVSLTADANAATQVIAVPTTTFAVGDLVMIADSQLPSPLSTAGQGQLSVVYSIDSASQLTLLDPTYAKFLTASSAFVRKISPIKDVRVTGLRFVNNDATNTSDFLRIAYAQRVVIDVEGYGSGAAGVRLNACYDFTVNHACENYYDTSITTLSQFGYGVAASGACAHGRVSVQAKQVRHAFTTTGPIGGLNFGEPVNITATGTAHGTTAQAWDTHAQGSDITLFNCQTYGAWSYGYGVRAKRVKIIGGSVSNSRGGVWIFEKAANVEVRGLSISNITQDATHDTSGAAGRGVYIDTVLSDVRLDGISISDVDQDGIEIRQAVTNLDIINSYFKNLGKASVSGHKSAVLFNAGCTTVRIAGNTCMDPQTSRTTLNFTQVNNTCNDLHVTDNRVQSGIVVVTGTVVKVGRNYGQASYEYRRVVTYAASLSIDTTLQATATITLTGNLTLTAVSGGTDGQVVRFMFIQDATGSRTVTFPANVKLAGGAFTTSGASKTDTLTLMYDGTNWYETGRGMNL